MWPSEAVGGNTEQVRSVAFAEAMKVRILLRAKHTDVVQRVDLGIGDSDAAEDVPVEFA